MNSPEILKLEKVLHVEDEKIHRVLMRTWFPDWGWHEASTLKEGLEIIQRERNNFQLILLDLNLPDSKGIGTLEEYHACSISPKVVSTGGDTEEIQARATELGVYGIIEKAKSFTKERIRPILLNAYREWRDPRLCMELDTLNEQVRAVTDRREKWIRDHDTKIRK